MLFAALVEGMDGQQRDVMSRELLKPLGYDRAADEAGREAFLKAMWS